MKQDLIIFGSLCSFVSASHINDMLHVRGARLGKVHFFVPNHIYKLQGGQVHSSSSLIYAHVTFSVLCTMVFYVVRALHKV